VELAPDIWPRYFGELVDDGPLLASIEWIGRQMGVAARIEALRDSEGVRHPLRAIGYREHTDTFEVAVSLDGEEGPRLRYFVASPARIFVEQVGATSAILIKDASGGRTLVCVSRPRTNDAQPRATPLVMPRVSSVWRQGLEPVWQPTHRPNGRVAGRVFPPGRAGGWRLSQGSRTCAGVSSAPAQRR
jgi:hypothetical protein